jgi:hypothetical protein
MGFVIAVPSYRRADVFRKRAYPALSPELRRRTYVFVQTPEDHEVYSSLFPDVRVVPVKQGQRWKAGFSFVNVFIRHYFPLGKKICFLHDDVAGVSRFRLSGGSCVSRRVDLSIFLPYVFKKMKELGAKLAGVYPTRRCRESSAEISQGLKFIYDPLHFEINVRLPECRYATKCDYEMTAEYYLRHGDVIRFDRHYARTKHEPLKGNSWTRTPEKLQRELEGFLRRYSPLISRVHYHAVSGDFSPQFRPFGGSGSARCDSFPKVSGDSEARTVRFVEKKFQKSFSRALVED